MARKIDICGGPEANPVSSYQFTKAANVLRGMGLAHLAKNETAIQELTDKGMAPD